MRIVELLGVSELDSNTGKLINRDRAAVANKEDNAPCSCGLVSDISEHFPFATWAKSQHGRFGYLQCSDRGI